MNIEQAMEYIGKCNSYTRRALNMTCQLGFAEKNGNKYFANGNSAELVKMKKSERYIIFRKHLQSFEPFIIFLALKNKGNTINESTRKLKTIYSLDLNQKEIRAALLNWGQYAQIFDYDSSTDEIKLNVDLENSEVQYLRELLGSLDSEIKTKIYLTDKLTEYVYGYLEDDEIEHLTRALMNHERNPRNSIADSGRALEDFLRRILHKKGYDVSNFQGITNIAEYIGSKERKIIHEKQKKILMGLAAIRNLASHNKDSKILESWKISPDFAIEVILITISLIRSLYYYIERGELTM
ncbi:MAG: hypothetical protein HXS54_14585 [Theionarchaea archaeon]|nr:hypothetical protein [Theionarchaea archaeon]